MVDVSIVDIDDDLFGAVERVFELTVPGEELIKSSGEVFLKPNGIDFKPYAYTDPLVLDAVIRYFYDAGASKVFVMENSTQANITRLVFALTGYNDVCKRTGAKPIFLDENASEPVNLPNFEDQIEFPRLVVQKLMKERDAHTYVSVPKLKTHSMSTVTLGVKNQMAFPHHKYRGYHHNYDLHRFLADLYTLVQPDFTLIDGTNAVYNGHYPLRTFLSESLDELGILIGGTDTLATDVIGARVLGYGVDEVKHLAQVRNDGNGVGDINKIEVSGTLSRFTRIYPHDILDKMPSDIEIVRGKDLLCTEGCDLNTRMVVQLLHYDHGGRGGFTILMGKGFEQEKLDSIEGKVLLSGDCAIKDARETLEMRLGRKNVFTSPTCNRLASTISALCKLMEVSTLNLVPSKMTAVRILLSAKIHGSKALVADLF